MWQFGWFASLDAEDIKPSSRPCNLAASKAHCSLLNIFAESAGHTCAAWIELLGYSPSFYPNSRAIPFLISYVHSWREKIDSRTGRRKTRGAHYWLRENDGARTIMIRHETPGVTWVIVNYLFPLFSLGVNNLFYVLK